MTKLEVIEALRKGEKVAHEYFTDGEWMKYNNTGMIEFEDGCVCYPYQFWETRTDDYWEKGWRIAS